jgi:hypothetical protein
MAWQEIAEPFFVAGLLRGYEQLNLQTGGSPIDQNL